MLSLIKKLSSNNIFRNNTNTNLACKKTKKTKICKDNVCVDTRLIKPRRMKRNTKNEKKIVVYYFYDIETKTLHRLSISTYNKFKDKKGFLLENEYRYMINDFPDEPSHHLTYCTYMLFTKYSEKDIKADPSWGKDSGISIDKPYAFGVNFKKNKDSDELSKVFKYIKVNNKSKVISKNKLKKYISDVEKGIEKLNFKILKKLEPHIDTYDNLLHKYYHESNWRV